MKTKKQKNKRKLLGEIIILAYDSLQTHISYTYIKSSEGKKFHLDAIKQYQKIINNALELF